MGIKNRASEYLLVLCVAANKVVKIRLCSSKSMEPYIISLQIYCSKVAYQLMIMFDEVFECSQNNVLRNNSREV